MLVLGTAIAWTLIAFAGKWFQKPATTNTAVGTNTNSVPLVFYRSLDGVLVKNADDAHPFPVGIMIENLPEVRPQSGLSDASVVYEAPAEGGSTRFLAVFAGPGKNLAKIGPERSVRPYYLEWFAEYNGLIGHAGGSPDALRMIQDYSGYHDFNGIGAAGKYHWRDHGIAAPHNLFTSSELITRALRDQNFTTEPAGFRPWLFQDEASLADRPASGQYVRVQFSGKAFEVEYHYDQATNSYLRFNSGVEHKDALTDQQIAAKNVVVQVIPPVLDVGEKGRLTLDVHGTGTAYIFRDGKEVVGTWKKANRTDRTIFSDASGNEIQFNRGNTWVEVVPSTQKVEAGTL